MVKLGLGMLGLVACMSMATPAAAADTKQPLLSIAVDNGQTAVSAGDRLTYTIKIHNIGTVVTKRLAISQSLPPGLTFVSADRGGAAKAGKVLWSLDLKAGEQQALTTVATVGATPVELLRLATVACATAKGDRKPRVCATHSDLLPVAGAATARPERQPIFAGLGTAVLVMMGFAGIAAVRRFAKR